ncbi:MAG TPA: glycosyltransferase family 4 protein [Rhodothermales bacterium]|nr:glycosyltransferase family 4 protein [Rhodothermales bacterium]
MSPRLLFVNHSGVLGGGELSLLDIVRHFRGTSRVVVFEDGPFREGLTQAGVDVQVLGGGDAIRKVVREGGLMQDLKSIPWVLGLSWRLAQLARDFDLLYANSQKSMIVAALAGVIARKPVVWHLRDLMTRDHFSPTHCRLVAAFANLLTTRVIANSEATRAALLEIGVRSDRVATVYNGVDPAPFLRVTPREAAEMRVALGLAGVPVVGVFSRLASWKGQHILLDALRGLPGVHALIVGSPLFQEDHAYEEALRQKARQPDLVGRVHFLGFRRDIPQLMQVVDVVVHTSVLPEPFGRVIVEGMLARKPVVAMRGGGALEIIEPGKTGCLVPPEDPSSLSAVLDRLLRDGGYAESLASAAQEAALGDFSVERMLQALDGQIHQVTSRKGVHR